MAPKSLRETWIQESAEGEWRKIPGFDTRYEISEYGIIRKLYKLRPPRIVKTRIRRRIGIKHPGSDYEEVKLKDAAGRWKQVKVHTIMGRTFLGTKPGQIVIHKDGMFTNNELENLQVVVDSRKLGRMTGGLNSKRRTVAKITKDGQILEVYKSVAVAATANNWSSMSVSDRCNKKIKKEFAADGTSFRFYDDIGRLESELKRLREAAVRAPGDPIPQSDWEW